MASSAILLFTDYFNHPSIPAYILAGIIVGRFFPQEEMLSFVQIGLAFLVFIFGVKMDPERLRSVAKESQIAGGIQITVIGLISLTAGYFLFNFNPINSILFTLSAVLSSTLVGLDILEREIHINLTHARLAESIHLTQDVIAILILIGLGSVQTILTNIPQNLYYGLMIIAASLAFRQILFDQLTKLTGGSRELMMLLSITVLSAFIGAAQYFNISLAVGSFAAGLAVSKYPYNIEILDTTGSLKDFFSAIFFVSLGALITTPTQKVLMVSALLIALTSIFKPYTVITALILQGHNKRTSYLTGMSIDQVSELALIIAIQTHLAGIMNDVLFQAIILTATFSMLTSSYTQRHKEEIYRFMSKYDILPDAETTIRTRIDGKLENHVILVGYDTQGKRLADKLKEENQQFVVLENDPEKVEELHDNNDNYIFSDIMEDETWQKAEIEEAKLIISTIPLRSASNKITGLETDADIILRSEEVKEAEKLLENDKVIYVNIPDMTGAELLSDHIEGIMGNVNYREELRRKNMLELRKYLQSEEG